jgi:LacI family transcriptional regulator
VVHPCDRSSPTFLQDVRTFVERQKLFGVVLPPSVSEDERVAKLLREIGCEYIRIASVELDKPEHMIVGHDRLGGEAMGAYLVELGHIARSASSAACPASARRTSGEGASRTL